MEEKPSYYAIIPANVRYNENLNSSQKLFYGEITALTFKTGECWASNNYFARLYKVSPSLITNWVKALEKEKLITVDYEKKGKEITKRIIKIICIQNIEYVFNKQEEGYSKYLKENNTSISNKENNNINIITKERFKKPTIEDIKKYCDERNNDIDPKKFFDYYEVNDWKDNKGNQVKNWKQKLITWEKHTYKTKEDVPSWFDKKLDTEEPGEELEELLKELSV